jgi:hypothetical protein
VSSIAYSASNTNIQISQSTFVSLIQGYNDNDSGIVSVTKNSTITIKIVVNSIILSTSNYGSPFLSSVL